MHKPISGSDGFQQLWRILCHFWVFVALYSTFPVYADDPCSAFLIKSKLTELSRLRANHEFTTGDLILVVGDTSKDELEYAPAAPGGYSLVTYQSVMPRLGEFIRMDTERGHAIVRLYDDFYDLESRSDFYIPINQIRPSAWGSLDRLRTSLNHVLGIDEVPAQGIRPGFSIPSWMSENFHPDDDAMKTLIAGARQLRSLPEFQHLPQVAQIRLIEHFLQSLVKWDWLASEGKFDGAPTFRELILSGSVVCRHFALILGILLKDANFEVYLVDAVDGGNGHAWLEVHLRDKRNRKSHHIVDPSNHTGYVRSLTDIRKSANAFETRWYLGAKRGNRKF